MLTVTNSRGSSLIQERLSAEESGTTGSPCYWDKQSTIRWQSGHQWNTRKVLEIIFSFLVLPHICWYSSFSACCLLHRPWPLCRSDQICENVEIWLLRDAHHLHWLAFFLLYRSVTHTQNWTLKSSWRSCLWLNRCHSCLAIFVPLMDYFCHPRRKYLEAESEDSDSDEDSDWDEDWVATLLLPRLVDADNMYCTATKKLTQLCFCLLSKESTNTNSNSNSKHFKNRGR